MKFAIIGCAGYIARRHMDIIHKLGHEIVAACDISESVGHLDKYGMDISFSKYEDNFLAKCRRREAEVLVVCTPNHLHARHVIGGVNNGMDVICEKPLCLNSQELFLLKKADHGRQVIKTILQMRHHPDVHELRQDLNDLAKEGMIYGHLNYLAPRGEWYAQTWKGRRRKSGGIIMNIGIHMVDMLCHVFGKMSVRLIARDADRTELLFQNDLVRVSAVLSTNPANAPQRSLAIANWGKTYCFKNIDGLHEKCYHEIMAARGPGVDEAGMAIKLIEGL
jgi:UDP-N-acetyl-2-amino-2-deoxyglucuronate dehydrogenase